MRRLVAIAALVLGILASGSAFAGEQWVTLRVENMFCASCPFIVKQTLANVPGVSHVEVSYEEETAVAMATVVYEDKETDAAALASATSDVGFPSTVIQ